LLSTKRRASLAIRLGGFPWKNFGGCVQYRLQLSDFARHQLTSLPSAVVDTLLDCLNELNDDPFRDPNIRVTLVVPLYRIFPDAYLCGQWAIAFRVRRQDEILVEAFGNTFY